MYIDTHAHIFRANISSANVVRYVPNYDASCEQYLANLKEFNFSYGVLVQPSFLGFDNSYLLQALKEHSNLRGIVVIDPNNISDLKEKNVCGLRLNLIGKDKPNFDDYKEALEYIKEFNLHIELHKELDKLLFIIDDLAKYNVKIMIDHLARPNKDTFKLLDEFNNYKNLDINFKVSGFYRLDEDLAFSKDVFDKLSDIFDIKHFVYGSDWPHTNYESKINYQKALDDFLKVTNDKAKIILQDNAKELFFI
ncbi:amidohydrolase family protein [Campylobacter sp. RM9333]|uniref:amidohydrolase family protein n=1 Tax=Campylobacter sp. RM9333 TaxID=2735731 RepID=UPI001D2EEA10|nr:amidohydrolase family protein [Campylobacter sp. RM9333]